MEKIGSDIDNFIRKFNADKRTKEKNEIKRKESKKIQLHYTRSEYGNYVRNACKHNLVSKIKRNCNKYEVYFRSGIVAEIKIRRKFSTQKEFYPKCFSEVFCGFKKVDLSKLKKVDDCDLQVNFGNPIKTADECNYIKIDINRCYFNVAHVLGFISDSLYEKYQEKKYKFSANVAIGCTASEEMVIEIGEDGKQSKCYYKPNKLAKIRANILDYVANIYKEVSSTKGINIVYFHTDCFYLKKSKTNEKNIKKIIKILEKYGLTAKTE